MDFLYVLQGIRTPFLDAVFQFFTFFGEETLFLVLALVIFWCVDKKCGYFLIYVCFVGTAINQFLKLVCRIPRPWVRDPDFTIVESAREAATGYSFPSGHTQSSSGLFFGVARYTKRRALRIACVVLTVLVGFSRMYLGVHTPADVLTSLLLSILLVCGAYPLFCRAWAGERKWYGVLFAALLLLCAAFIVYAEFARQPAAIVDENQLSALENAYKLLGGALALLLSMVLDERYIRFDTAACPWAQALKVALGLALVMSIRVLTKAPLLTLTGGHPLAGGIRYFLMVVFAGSVWPLTFKRFARLSAAK
ncbi:MAG: phosphatase PAP2 family protein [Clostridia bacterium]|nr:phosphatase PAP2 family protein [Clostridia bacterium]